MGGRNPDYMSGGYNPARDSRTLTWDRNPKPDRNDPKYFPVNSLPRHPGQSQPGGPHPVAGNNSINSPGMALEEGMPPPMRELNTNTSWTGSTSGPVPGQSGGPVVGPSDYRPTPVSGGSVGGGGGTTNNIPPAGGPGDYYTSGNGVVESEPGPGRGQRLLHRMAQGGGQDAYNAGGGRHSGGGSGEPPATSNRGYR